MSKNIINYNLLWQKKSQEPDRLLMQERVLKTFKSLFSNLLELDFKGSLLDIGSGDGSFVEVCKKSGIEAVGIDISNGVNFEKDNLAFKDNTFDFALMYSVLEHLKDPSNILSEAFRVLKPGGKLLVITSNFELSSLFLCDKEFFNDPTHIHPYNRKSIRLLMRMYHFKEKFIGLWTVCKSPLIWKIPEMLQFYYGVFLPFRGTAKYVPLFLKGRSKSMLCVFEK